MKYWTVKLDPRMLTLSGGSVERAYIISFLDSFLTWKKTDNFFSGTYSNIANLLNLDKEIVKKTLEDLQKIYVITEIRTVTKRIDAKTYKFIEFKYNRAGVNEFINTLLDEEQVEDAIKELSK